MSEPGARVIPAALDEAVGFNLYRVALLFRRELMVALKAYGLTPEQRQILEALWSTEEEVQQQTLCALTLKDKHAMSRMLARMERDGWVKRRKDPQDLRAVFVRATPKAREHASRIRQQLRAHFKSILSALSPDDTAHLMRSLRTFRDLLETKEQPT